ncbi:putative toxin-antitoxin system toxin component, PIN family [Candidatus Gottesmanbacteria bacterium]|nr:putative toxin-antitoxin system toxin component, PIN family [Candidatus Gottesmanbacteria bacterium]
MPSDTPKVFCDTNVWFSAFYGSKNCEKLLNAHINRKIMAVISKQVLEELIRNFREKLPQALSIFQEFITSCPPEIIIDPKTINPKVKNLVSPEDGPIFTSAIIGRVDYFITGNRKDFKIARLEKLTGIKILSPKQAVRLFGLV